MTDEQLLKRFRDLLESHPKHMVRGAALGLAITTMVQVDATDVVEFLDEYCRLWRELRLEAQLT